MRESYLVRVAGVSRKSRRVKEIVEISPAFHARLVILARARDE
jgi:hypothetical protein